METKEAVISSDDEHSRFTGGAFANAGIKLLTGFVSLITLGLAYPAMVCRKLKWKAKHTYINGRRLYFDGNGAQLWGKYILWNFLSVITLGLYLPFRKMKMVAWETKHTHFFGVPKEFKEQNPSHFTGTWYQLLGVNWLTNFVTMITLSIGYYWAHCYKEKWYQKHKIIDGAEITFDGTGAQYFGKRIVWTLLTIVTVGIYSFWLSVKSLNWTVSHMHVSDPALVPFDFSAQQADSAAEYVPPKNKTANAGFAIVMTLGLIFAFSPIAILGLRSVFPELELETIPIIIQYPDGTINTTGYYMTLGVKLLITFFSLSLLFNIAGLTFSIIGLKTAPELEGRGKKLAKAGISLAVIFIVIAVGSFVSCVINLHLFTPYAY